MTELMALGKSPDDNLRVILMDKLTTLTHNITQQLTGDNPHNSFQKTWVRVVRQY